MICPVTHFYSCMQRVALWLIVVVFFICTRWCESLLARVGKRFSVHHVLDQHAERNALHSNHNCEHGDSVVSESPHEVWYQRKQAQTAERALKLAIQAGLAEPELTSHFKEYSRHLRHERAAILRANELFFRAQTIGDLSALLGLWSRAADTICSTRLATKGHPACGRVIRGFPSIANYLAKHTPTLRDYSLRDVRLSFFGALAVVSCTVDTHKRTKVTSEPGASKGAIGAVTATHYVTNVFELAPEGGGRYLLRSHTSSAHPGSPQGRDREARPALRSTYRDPTMQRRNSGGAPRHPFGRGGAGTGAPGGRRLALDLGRLGRLLFGPGAGAGGLDRDREREGGLLGGPAEEEEEDWDEDWDEGWDAEEEVEEEEEEEEEG